MFFCCKGLTPKVMQATTEGLGQVCYFRRRGNRVREVQPFPLQHGKLAYEIKTQQEVFQHDG